MTGETDAEGNAKQYEYDPVGRLVAVVDPLDNQVSYAYTPEGRLSFVTKADGNEQDTARRPPAQGPACAALPL